MGSGREKFQNFKFFISVITALFKALPKSFLLFIWNSILPFNGLLPKALRYCMLKAKAKSVGDNVSIGANTYIKYWDRFTCGNNVSIHEFCMIDCDGGISIGNDVSIAHGTSLISANHTWNDQRVPIKYNPLTKLGIQIKDDVWVGAGVRILDGITVNSRSVIAAGAVVNKDVLPNCIVGGIPAKMIKSI
jgi:acetyltransferase-like isoleucine patch superfamily enzyme